MNTQISLSLPNVIIHDGKVVTTSQSVADYFIKQHKNVIQKIESLDCSPEFTRLNFQPSEYTDSTGRKLPMYEMTKDGFIFLVMGFTGKKAAAFKEAYICEFNRMEAELLNRPLVKPKRQKPDFRYHISLSYRDNVTGQEERFSGVCNTPEEIVQGTARKFGMFITEMIDMPFNAYC